MTGHTPADTRSRILSTALELFAADGYQRTSLRAIAERLGLTKAAVLYHFPAKERILAALTEPLLDDLEDALDRASQLPPQTARWVAVEGLLDGFLAHRQALLMLRHDLSPLTQNPESYHRFLTVGTQAYRIIAGPDADLAAVVRASQAVALLGDPVVYFADAPAEALRELILAGAHRLLDDPGQGSDRSTTAGAEPAAARSRRVGRPPALDAERLARARRMHAAGEHSVAEIAAAVGVSRATLYRHLREDPSSQTEKL